MFDADRWCLKVARLPAEYTRLVLMFAAGAKPEDGLQAFNLLVQRQACVLAE
jgi:hypothetical protein